MKGGKCKKNNNQEDPNSIFYMELTFGLHTFQIFPKPSLEQQKNGQKPSRCKPRVMGEHKIQTNGKANLKLCEKSIILH